MPRRVEPDDFYTGGPLWGSLRKPDEPPAPTTEEWLARIRSRALNADGAPTASVRQSERAAPDWDRPFITRDAP